MVKLQGLPVSFKTKKQICVSLKLRVPTYRYNNFLFSINHSTIHHSTFPGTVTIAVFHTALSSINNIIHPRLSDCFECNTKMHRSRPATNRWRVFSLFKPATTVQQTSQSRHVATSKHKSGN